MSNVSINILADRWPLSKDEKLALVEPRIPRLIQLWEGNPDGWPAELHLVVCPAGAVATSQEQSTFVQDQGEAMAEQEGGGFPISIMLTDMPAGIEKYVLGQLEIPESRQTRPATPTD